MSSRIENIRNLKIRNLIRKYQALFINLFEYDGLDYRVDDFIMRKLLHTGQLSSFKLITNPSVSIVGYASYIEKGYNLYSEPIKIQVINERNSKELPKKDLIIGTDAAIIKLDFIPQTYIRQYAEEIADIEMTMRTHLKTLKMPFIISGSDNKTIKAIQKLLSDEEVIYLEDMGLKVQTTGVQYILEKLQRQKVEVENELYTILGIDNVKFEKAAQMNVDEINANNHEINAFRGIIKSSIHEWFEETNRLFGTTISIVQPVLEVEENGEEENAELL